MKPLLAIVLATLLAACADSPDQADSIPEWPTAPYVVVLGISQDGGTPQIGRNEHPGWMDASRKELVSSLALVDPVSGERWIFDATPDMRQQLFNLEQIAGPPADAALSGIFLTHAHMGHYTGLMFLGHESMGASGIPVHAMPQMSTYLSSNGPWDQLVRYENIELRPLADGVPMELNERLSVIPLLVPHRQEYSEVVGFRIRGEREVLFIPDIDQWELLDDMGVRIEDLIQQADVSFLDASFYANGEIPGRDMSGFPHPFITHSMNRFDGLDAQVKSGINFIHLNHTNPALDPESEARAEILRRGFNVARQGQIVSLSSGGTR